MRLIDGLEELLVFDLLLNIREWPPFHDSFNKHLIKPPNLYLPVLRIDSIVTEQFCACSPDSLKQESHQSQEWSASSTHKQAVTPLARDPPG